MVRYENTTGTISETTSVPSRGSLRLATNASETGGQKVKIRIVIHRNAHTVHTAMANAKRGKSYLIDLDKELLKLFCSVDTNITTVLP